MYRRYYRYYDNITGAPGFSQTNNNAASNPSLKGGEVILPRRPSSHKAPGDQIPAVKPEPPAEKPKQPGLLSNLFSSISTDGKILGFNNDDIILIVLILLLLQDGKDDDILLIFALIFIFLGGFDFGKFNFGNILGNLL